MERLVVSQVRHNVLGEVVLHHCEVGNHGVYLLRGCLFCHHPKTVLLVCHWLPHLVQLVCLVGYVQFGGFALALFVREGLPPLEFLL